VQLDEFICGEGNCVIMIKIATATGHSIGIRLQTRERLDILVLILIEQVRILVEKNLLFLITLWQ
jgi:hypothetical protein